MIDDPDLTAATIDVRIRSVAGRLVDKITVQASRDPSGKYRAQVNTRSAETEEPKTAIGLAYGGQVIVDYQDSEQPAVQNVERVAYLALASDAALAATNAGYYDAVSRVRLGEPVYLQVTDHDADRSPGIDQVAVVATSAGGDRVLATLAETEPHSGMFRGKIQTDNAAPNADDDILQAQYGGTIQVVYQDRLRQTVSSSAEKMVRLDVLGGADGLVEGFSRHFGDAQEEMKLWHRTGQSAYEIGRRLYLAGSYERAEEYLTEATDYFRQLVSRFPQDPLAASAGYYLGNIQSLKGNHREALDRFQDVVSRWPKSDFVARARYKTGQELEALDRFDEAADAYVLLTYHHPQDPHVPLAMIRMMNHFARAEQFDDGVSVAQKFVEKFPKHEHAGTVALKAGQWLAVSSKATEAAAWFTQVEKQFAGNDQDMPGLLYWHAITLLQPVQGGRPARGPARPEKVRELLQRVIYDYPKSPYANLARQAMEAVIDTR